MATPKLVTLRVLITINSSNQWILAKSRQPVQVTPVLPANPTDIPTYGTVSLKTCMRLVADASPDVSCDATRDFTVYLLDPLESQTIPNLNMGSQGSVPASNGPMAVAQGSMSRALNASDAQDVQVAGTFMMRGTEPHAVEVIFAFRDAKPQAAPPPPPPPSTTAPAPLIRSHSQPVASSSSLPKAPSTAREAALSRAKPKAKPVKPPRQSTTPVTESDKLLNAETYIGPLKKKGRPKANVDSRSASLAPFPSSSQEVIVLDGSDSDGVNHSSGSKPNPRAQGVRKVEKQATPPLYTTTALAPSSQLSAPAPLPQPSTDPGTAGIGALASLFADPNAALILQLLSKIDSGSQPPQGLDFVALQQLLACVNKNPPPPESALPSTSQAAPNPVPHPTPVDKENVKPPVYRKSSEKDLKDTKPSERRSSYGLSSSSRANEVANTKPPARETTTDRGTRKRTLSDFMDERENRNREKGKEKDRGEPREVPRQSSLNFLSTSRTTSDALRHYPRLVDQPRSDSTGSSYYRTGMEPWTSPVRPPPPMPSASTAPSTVRTFLKPASPRVQHPSKLSNSSPARSASFDRTNFRMPAWAVTKTATQPRLSEQARLAKEEAEERKNEAKKAARRNRAAAAKKSKPTPSEGPSAPASTPAPPVARPRPPIAPSASRPVFAAANIAFPYFGSSRPSSPVQSSSPIRPSSPTPSRPSIPQTPKTPVRRRVSSSLTTPKAGGDSLFTPTPGGGGSLFGSGCSSRSPAALPSIFTSPLGNRKKPRTSSEYVPTRLGTSPRTPLAFPGSSSTSSAKSTAAEESEEELATQLENAFDEDMGSPPSSLPVASSDTGEDSQTGALGGDEMETDTDIDSPIKQHWNGLPPSSPPPPSSPQLLPETIPSEEDMDEVPIATSDSDADPDTDIDMSQEPAESPFENSITATPRQHPSNNPSVEQQEFMNPEEAQAFAQLLALSEGPGSDAMFEQFTNLNAANFGSSDLAQWDLGPNNAFFDPNAFGMEMGNTMPDMTLEGFWETVKPLIDGTQVEADPSSNSVSTTTTSTTASVASDSSDTAPSPSTSTSSTDASSSSAPSSIDFGDFGSLDSQAFNLADFDATKLAGEMHSLLSGFLV